MMQENALQSSSTNYFTRAMELTHMCIAGVTQQERLAAEQYLMTLRNTAEGLNLSFHIINNEPVHDLRCFWAFNTIMHHLPSLACTVNDTQAEELYRVLFSFIYRYFFSSTVQRQTTDFLANKHAQMMIVGLQYFFPLRWRSFFDDVFELFALRETLPHVGDAVTVYFLRLFEYIDERVVSVRAQVDRCRELRARDMELKDAMREHVIPRAVSTWYVILCECRIRATEIANICLCVLQTYIEWVDVALFMTGEWINLFYFFVTVPSLRSAACECIFSLVEKKQQPAVKFESLCALNIVDALPRIVGLLQLPPSTDEDLNFLEVVARLTRAVAEQFFALYEYLSSSSLATAGGSGSNKGNNINSVSSSSNSSNNIINNNNKLHHHNNHHHHSDEFFNDKNISSNGDVGFFVSKCYNNNYNSSNNKSGNHFLNKNSIINGKEKLQLRLEDGCLSIDLLKDVNRALDVVVTHLLHLLSINLNEVSSSIFPFIQIYAKSTALGEAQAAQLLLILYEHTRIFDIVENEGKIWLEEVVNQRKQSHNFIRLLFVRYPSIVYQHLQAVISRITTAATEKEQQQQEQEQGGKEAALLFGYGGTISGDVKFEYQQQEQEQQRRAGNLGCVNNNGGINCQNADEIEAALRYLYELGESFKMDKLKYMDNEFSQLVAAVLSSETIANCSCAVVHLSYFEVFDRYYHFFIYHKEYIPVLLKCFLLSPNGVTNRHGRVRARICYLFGHMIQLLKRHLLPHRESIVNAIHDIVLSNVLLPSDLCELYEAAGSLYSVAPVSSAKEIRDKTMITHVVQTVLQSLQHVSLLPSPAVGFAFPNAVGYYSAPSETVADTISFLTAFAKGLRGNNNNNNNNNSGDGANSASFADVIAAEMFHEITRDVIEALRVWHLSACVRERVGQYFTQMVHTLPFESMEVYFATYLADWLTWMETVPELTKLLRLLHQFINCGGARVAAALADVLPPVMRKVASVGELSASPDEGGVVSESTREKREVHRQLFSVLHGATHAGCVAVVMSLPRSELTALFSRLLEALYLPSESELPKLALQIMTKITTTTTEWESSVTAQCDCGSSDGHNKNFGICNCNGANNNTNDNDNNNSSSNSCCGGATNTAIWLTFMLNNVVPAVFVRFALPTFELKDAKNFFLIGEVGLLLKALMNRLGPDDCSLSSLLYAIMQPAVGEEEARGFVAALQTERRFSAEMKRRFCYILQMIRERGA